MPKEILERAAGDQKPPTHSQRGDLTCAHEVVSTPARDPKKIAGFLHGIGEALSMVILDSSQVRPAPR
jgi:hypothetical protein